MEINILMLCIGLTICFGGIYFRKIVSGLLGLVWGIILGFVVVLLLGLSRNGGLLGASSMDDGGALAVLLIVAVIVCALSVWLERICAAINTFLSSFMVLLIIFLLMAQNDESARIAFCMALLVSFLISCAAYVYYNYAYIIVTAFSGAFIASVAGIGLFTNMEFSNVLAQLILYQNNETAASVCVYTLLLGSLGLYVQFRRINGNKNGTEAERSNSQTLKPFLENMEGKLQSSRRAVNSEMNRGDLKTAIWENKWLFIPTLVNTILIPLAYNFPIYQEIVYTILHWTSTISGSMAIGVLVYLVITQDMKLNLIYLVPYTLGFVIFNSDIFVYYSTFGLIVDIFNYWILWGILYVASKIIKKSYLKPPSLAFLAFLSSQYIIPWIAARSIMLYVNLYSFIRLVTIVGTVFLMFWLRHQTKQKAKASQGQDVVILPVDSNAASRTTSNGKRKQCPQCQKIYSDEYRFCRVCGTRLKCICPNCGSVVSTEEAFCKQCGKPL